MTPKEGVTGWLDTWMMSAKAKHPNCAYLWWNYISARQGAGDAGASTYGETPVNKKACVQMEKLAKGSCKQYSANAPAAYYKSIKFWKTPVTDCGDIPGQGLHVLLEVGAGLDAGEGVGQPRRGGRRHFDVDGGPSAAGGPSAHRPPGAWRRPGAKALGQIGLPLAAFLIVYVAALVALLVSSFWSVDEFTERGRAHLGLRQLPDALGGPDVSPDRASHRRASRSP